MVGLAGCGGDSGDGGGDGGNGGGGDADSLDVVPASATSVTYADVGGMIQDDTVGDFLSEVFSTAGEQEEYDGPADREEMLDEIEAETGLDPREMGESVGFSKTPETPGTATPGPDEIEQTATQYSGTWLTAGWSEDDIVAAIESEAEQFELESSEHNGYTVYEPVPAGDETAADDGSPASGMESENPPARMGVIADGEYVTGTQAAVEDALDVAAGDTNSAGDELRNVYSGVRGGLLKMASTVPENLPQDSLPQGTVGEGDVDVQPERLEEIEGGALVFYTDGGGMSMSASMTAESEESAGHVVEIIDGAIASTKRNVEDEDLAAKLDDISVEQDGQSVSVDYANDMASISEIIDLIAEEFTGAPVPMTPTGTPSEPGYSIGLPV
jgi:hypothetical protein